MDDEDARHLLDILGDVDALNDYLHGNNSKSIEEDDVTNAAYGSDGSLFATDTTSSSAGLKDGSSTMAEFGSNAAGASLQLSGSLSFIEDELGSGSSPGDVDLGGEDQPFDILQKSLMEADITEQTLAEGALLDSQPAPTLVQAPVPFPSQLVSGGNDATAGGAAPTAFPTGQLLQGMPQLPNGSTQHIQVLGSFGGASGVMTLSSLERTPQIVLRPGVSVAPAVTGGQVFAPTQGQVGLPFKNIPLQNIIIQKGPGGAQALVRPIQPKPLQGRGQTVFRLGLQPTPTTMTNVVIANSAAAGGQYTAANGSIVVQSPVQPQQQIQGQRNVAPGQFLLPTSLALTPSTNSNALIANQNAVQIVAGQNFAAPADGQLILNQGVVSRSQVGNCVTQTWTGVSCVNTSAMQTSHAPGRLTLVGPATVGVGGQGQASGCPVQRLLVTQTPNCASLSPLPGSLTQDQQDFRQNNSSPGFTQGHLGNIQAMKTMTQDSPLNAETRPASQPLTRGEMILQQVRKDHTRVQNPDRRHFSSFNDALQNLLPYHVFEGTPSTEDEFSQVDEEFEAVSTQVLMRTQSMVNKYRRLLLVEAERSSPSSEIVMIHRTFNQEERGNLTQDKRMVLVDPDTFLEEFCCGMKSKLFQEPSSSQPPLGRSLTPSGSPYRTDSQDWCSDPGGGGGEGVAVSTERRHSPSSDGKNSVDLKRPQHHRGSSHPQGKPSSFAAMAAAEETQYLGSQPPPPDSPSLEQHYTPPSPSQTDTDSALEAAVNSILEC